MELFIVASQILYNVIPIHGTGLPYHVKGNTLLQISKYFLDKLFNDQYHSLIKYITLVFLFRNILYFTALIMKILENYKHII